MRVKGDSGKGLRVTLAKGLRVKGDSGIVLRVTLS
jgi:hypothetical protein